MEKTTAGKTPQQRFIEELLASQASRVKQAAESGIHVSRIKKQDLIGLAFYDNELIMITAKDLEPFDFH